VITAAHTTEDVLGVEDVGDDEREERKEKNGGGGRGIYRREVSSVVGRKIGQRGEKTDRLRGANVTGAFQARTCCAEVGDCWLRREISQYWQTEELTGKTATAQHTLSKANLRMKLLFGP
jgi:hypothetical protein